MTKKGPLGTAEIFYVTSHYKEKEVSEIAKELDRPLVTVQRQVDELVGAEPPKTITSGSLMSRREGIVTMTEGASSRADERKTKTRKPATGRRTTECVTRTRNDSVHDKP
jgi:hypothetical protein